MIFVIHICISVLIIPDTEKYSTAMCYIIIIIIIIIVVNAHNYYPQSTLSSHSSFLDCSVRENSDIFICHHQQLFSFALTLAHNNNSSASSVDIIIMIIIILDGHYLRIVAFSIVSAWEFSSELLTFPFFTINNFHLPCLPCVKLPPRKFSTAFSATITKRCQMSDGCSTVEKMHRKKQRSYLRLSWHLCCPDQGCGSISPSSSDLLLPPSPHFTWVFSLKITLDLTLKRPQFLLHFSILPLLLLLVLLLLLHP